MPDKTAFEITKSIHTVLIEPIFNSFLTQVQAQKPLVDHNLDYV